MKYLVITVLTVFMAFASIGCDEPATEETDETVATDSVEVVEEVVTEEVIEEVVTDSTIVEGEEVVEEVVEGAEDG